MYNLGYFLIDSDRSINEGLELIDKVIELNPDSQWAVLEGKGWDYTSWVNIKKPWRFLKNAGI